MRALYSTSLLGVVVVLILGAVGALAGCGVVNGEAAFQFDGVTGLPRLDDGTLVVADGGSREIRYFDPAANHLVERVGRGGGSHFSRPPTAGPELDDLPPERQPGLRQELEAMPVPATKPAYGGILADEVGNLWVGEWTLYPQIPERWTILDR